MGELKAIGSEKLKGEAKIQRILDLTYYQSDKILKESSEPTKESKSGVYGVEKEKDGYYVKKGLNENSLDYIGGMFMKNKNKFSSYGEALKKMEFLIEQENLQEATKYVLKQPNAAPAPAPEVPAALPPEGGDPSMEAPLPGDEGIPAPEGDPNDFMSVLKKDAGELQQNLNKYKEQLESADYAEVVNQVLSAIDFEAMEDTDKESILDQLGAEENVEGATEVPGGELPPPVDAPVETSEMDGMSMDGVASLDELINTPLEDDFGYDGEDNTDDELMSMLDTDFALSQDDPEIAKAGRLAKKDMGQDEWPLYTGSNELKNPLDSDVNNVSGEASDDQELEELIRLYDDDGNVLDSPVSDRHQTGLDDPLDSDVNDAPGEASDDGDIREIDLDELTDMVNSNVKQTLGKYFE
jgi:hypothetical protein